MRKETTVDDAEGTQQAGIVGVFSRAAPTYDRIGPPVFAHFGQRLVDLAQIVSGAHVLDVAAGRGAVLFPVATRVGPRGRVIGIDLSADMVRETAADIQGAGWHHAEIQQMDADQLHFPDATFDVVLCGFALWLFPRPHRTLTELFRVLKPGGRLGITTWAEDSPFHTWCRHVLRPYAAPQASQTAAVQEAPRFDTPMQLATVLQQAGFAGHQIIVEDGDFVYTEEDEWWASLWSHGLRGQLEKMGAPVLAQAKTEVCQQVQVFKQADGIHTLYRALFALSTKPEY
jgi:ubiquinone/menaquinone biosynthesis C-methylase UbiE